MDAPIPRQGIKCLAESRRVLPATRYQRDRLRLPDDVRLRRRRRTQVHAVDPETHWRTTHMTRRQLAWVLILIVDVGIAAWGAMAAALPDFLLGPGGKPILPAGYEGFSGGSWSELVGTSPMTARYMEVLFRMYGVFNFAFGLMAIAITVKAFRRGEAWAWWALLVGNTIAYGGAMTYDRIVHAKIGR